MATGTKTALFSRKQPGGLITIESQDITTGDRWYVDSGSGTDGAGYGPNPDAPFATIDYAISNCTASQGDIIYVMPGHAENITTATGINCDVIGISIIGLGDGDLIPTVTFTAAAGSVTISVASVTIRNIKFVANFETGVTTGFTIAAGADGLTLDGVKMFDTSATFEFLVHASIATGVDRLLIKNCRFIGAAGTMSGSLVFAGTSLDAEICHNYWHVDSSDSVIHHDAGVASNMYLHHNACAEFKTASTGCAHDNRFGYNKVDAEVFKGDAMFWFENYMSNTIAESGLLMPATTHAIP
jgi:hypothetical protein